MQGSKTQCLSEEKLCIYIHTTSSLSIHPSIDTSCFHILATVNNAAIDYRVQTPFQISVLIVLR